MLFKMGREEEAIRVLLSYCPSVTEAVDFALALNLSDPNILWDMVLANSIGKTENLNELLQYVDLQ